MSTDYKILETDKGQLELWEHSNTFDLAVIKGNSAGGQIQAPVLRDLTTQQVIDLAFELLKVASYWLEPGAIDLQIEQKRKGRDYFW